MSPRWDSLSLLRPREQRWLEFRGHHWRLFRAEANQDQLLTSRGEGEHKGE